MKVTELFNIENRVAIVTGGAGLYGRNITEALLEAGCRVVIASRNLSKLEETRKEFKRAGYEKLWCYRLDLSSTDSIDSFVDSVYRDFTYVDVLVNNSVLRPMHNFNDDIGKWRDSMEVNATGTFYLTREVANRMAKRRKGSIINIVSIQGVVGVDPTLYEGTDMDGTGAPDYFFHKGGWINLTRFLASYYGKWGVRVNAVSPGGKFANQDPQFVKRYNDRTFLGRMADDDDIKGTIVFLASDASKYITGENIMVDGGYVQK